MISAGVSANVVLCVAEKTVGSRAREKVEFSRIVRDCDSVSARYPTLGIVSCVAVACETPHATRNNHSAIERPCR